MKPRIVIVTLEMETDAPLKLLKDRSTWEITVWHEGQVYLLRPRQASAQVATPARRPGKGKRP